MLSDRASANTPHELVFLCGTHKPHPLLADKNGMGVGGQV